MPLFPKDVFTVWLEGQGKTVKVYQPGAMYGAPPLGWQVPVGNSNLIYRLPEDRPGVVIVVMFERLGDRGGLRSPFADFIRFLSLLRKADLGVHTIEGRVEEIAGKSEDRMNRERMTLFYERYLGGSELRVDDDGVAWIKGALHGYKTPLATIRSEEDAGAAPPPSPEKTGE